MIVVASILGPPSPSPDNPTTANNGRFAAGTWPYDGTNWTRRSLRNGPSGRYFASMADPALPQ